MVAENTVEAMFPHRLNSAGDMPSAQLPRDVGKAFTSSTTQRLNVPPSAFQISAVHCRVFGLAISKLNDAALKRRGADEMKRVRPR